MTKGTETRTRIMDIAEAAVLAKGFDATSIDEIVAAAEITKGGFFYHFPDKNALARALIERYIETENKLFDDLWARARELNEDPLHAALIGLKLLAEMLEDMPNGHPGCIIASAAYQDRLFDAEVREMNRRAVLGWRTRFRPIFDEIAAIYQPREDVDLDALSDFVNTVVEGGLVMGKALSQPHMICGQIMLLRSYIRLLFEPRLQ
ncbi:Transcriptional regulator AcuR [Defluviimonas aquaemixtae]|uniref:Transcriptional regulator AcuR n=1 Tax=Albidovulum aquaemixtae TaxID=1542388 RepID=A0A2R8B5M8_9RHOB|nr:TetR/AcrR family transcriptional regulator [Defluviimonas aquaemixtae]SPH17830.1 Transcriptional regulator AcuR [Defluviimonas aquaemixtae]